MSHVRSPNDDFMRFHGNIIVNATVQKKQCPKNIAKKTPPRFSCTFSISCWPFNRFSTFRCPFFLSIRFTKCFPQFRRIFRRLLKLLIRNRRPQELFDIQKRQDQFQTSKRYIHCPSAAGICRAKQFGEYLWLTVAILDHETTNLNFIFSYYCKHTQKVSRFNHWHPLAKSENWNAFPSSRRDHDSWFFLETWAKSKLRVFMRFCWNFKWLEDWVSHIFPIPIGSMGLVYLPTFTITITPNTGK